MNRCIVLNNQHQVRIDEFAAIAEKDPDRIVLFQPYSGDLFKNVERLLKSETPVPLFLVVASYGDQVSAVGLLHKLEDATQLSQERKDELLEFISEHDEGGLYSPANILVASNIRKLRQDIELSAFIKESNQEPLKPGQWPCSVCFSPNLIDVLKALWVHSPSEG